MDTLTELTAALIVTLTFYEALGLCVDCCT